MKIAISIAETSGDILGSQLIKVIKDNYPNAEISGLMGDYSANAGGNKLWDSSLVSVMGFTEVIKKIIPILLLRQKMIKFWLKNPPDIFIGVDSPDFNFTIEKKFKAIGVKTIHFISPSIWAWRPERIAKIKQSTDIMLCLLPFEVDFYKKHNIEAYFLGHPFAKNLQLRTNYQNQKRILFMPGSRTSEIEMMLPTMVKIAQNIGRVDNDYNFHIALADDKDFEFAYSWKKGDKITISIGDAREQIQNSDLVIVASGTASLEVALLGVPMVVVYKMNPLSYQIAKRKLRIKNISLPNILAGKRIVPELIQDNFNVHKTIANIFQVLKDDNLHMEYAKIHQSLQGDFDDEVLKSIDKLFK